MTSEVFSSAPSRPAVFHHSCRAMGTRFSVILVGVEKNTGDALTEFAERHLRSQECLMNRFDPLSAISELNQCAFNDPVAVPPALWKILAQCRSHWQRTRGAFDITQWPLNQLWRESMRRGEEPSEDLIRQTRERTGMERLQFDDAAHTLKFASEGMVLDLGGFGKGYALEGLAEHFREQGIERAFFSFGESSVTVLGSHPHGPAWPVGIANMFHPETTVYRFDLRDASLSTSGTAPFNETGGPQNFGHIINPRDGRPIAGYRTMSVAAPSAIDAEVLSTALLVAPEVERAEILSGYPGVSAIEIVYEPQNDFEPRVQWRYET